MDILSETGNTHQELEPNLPKISITILNNEHIPNPIHPYSVRVDNLMLAKGLFIIGNTYYKIDPYSLSPLTIDFDPQRATNLNLLPQANDVINLASFIPPGGINIQGSQEIYADEDPEYMKIWTQFRLASSIIHEAAHYFQYHDHSPKMNAMHQQEIQANLFHALKIAALSTIPVAPSALIMGKLYDKISAASLSNNPQTDQVYNRSRHPRVISRRVFLQGAVGLGAGAIAFPHIFTFFQHDDYLKKPDEIDARNIEEIDEVVQSIKNTLSITIDGER